MNFLSNAGSYLPILLVVVALVVVFGVVLPRQLAKGKASSQAHADWAAARGWQFQETVERAELAQRFPVYPYEFPGLINSQSGSYARGQVDGREAGSFTYAFSGPVTATTISTLGVRKKQEEHWLGFGTVAYIQLPTTLPELLIERSDYERSKSYAQVLRGDDPHIVGEGKYGQSLVFSANPHFAHAVFTPAVAALLNEEAYNQINVQIVGNWLLARDEAAGQADLDELFEFLQKFIATVDPAVWENYR